MLLSHFYKVVHEEINCSLKDTDKNDKKGISKRYALHENKKLMHFLSLYIDSEFLAQKIVRYKRAEHNKKVFLSLNYLELVKSLKLFNLSVTLKLVKQIFKSGDGLRNHKIPMQLRNGLMHEKSIPDIHEILNRYEELTGYLNTWLDFIRQYINLE